MIKRTVFLSFLTLTAVYANYDALNDVSLMAKGIIKNAKEIERIDEQVKMILSDKNDIVEKSKNAKVVKVQQYAILRKNPGQNIQIYLPLGTNLYVEGCTEIKECEDCRNKVKKITWCYSPDFGGGYIAKNLIQFDKGPSQ